MRPAATFPRVVVSSPSLAAQPGTQSPSERPATAEAPAGRVRRHAGWLIAVVILTVSVVVVQWARTRPGFDPYGWLVWGHQTIHASLDTNAAPSWKPLPWLFTTVYALFGHYELKAWMVTSVAISLSGVVFAARIAHRLTDASPERRWAGWVAGAFAGLAVLGIQNDAHYILSFQSDPMIVSLCLGAIDAHLSGRVRSAFGLGVLASLGRPEVWPFLGLYSIWAWRERPRTRLLLAAGWGAIVLLWFGVPALTSRTPFVAAANANKSGRRLTSNQVLGTVQRFLAINELPVELAALVTLGLAIWRRQRTVLVLAAATVVWVIIEIAFALHGWPGLVRYMFEAGAVVIVLAGVCVGWLLSGSGPQPSIPRPLGAALVAVLVAGLIPAAISHGRVEQRDLHQQRLRTDEIAALTPAIDRVGGAARLNACGEPLTRLQYQTALAYALGLNVSKIGFKYSQSVAHGNPIVLYTPAPRGIGWTIRALHQTRAGCRSLPR